MKKSFISIKCVLSLVISFAIFATSLFTGMSLTVSAADSPVCAGTVSEYTARVAEVSLLDPESPNSESNPYIIETANQMYMLMRVQCTNGGTAIDTAGAYFKVADGIKAFYMNGGETVANMTTVAEIKNYFEVTNTSAAKVSADSSRHFKGSFDGNGVTIYGIRSDDYVGGLFPYASGTVTIKNVTVKNSYLKGAAGGGGLVGSCMGTGANPVSINIENCEVSNNYIASGRSGDGAGALLGFMYNSSANSYPVVTAKNCIVYGNELAATHATNPGGCFAIAGTLNSKNCKFTNCIFLDAFPFPSGANIKKAEVYENVYTDADLSTVGVTYTEGTIMSIGDTDPTGATGKAAMPLLDWDVWFATTSYPVLRAFHNIQTIDGDIQGCDCGISGIVPTIDVSSIGSKTLIDTTTEWRYLDNNTDPANGFDSLQAWTLLDFDDSSWKKASGKFGSKAGALAAVNGCGTPTVLLNLYPEDSTTTVIPAYFFRTTLNLSGVEALSGLEFQIYADDGMVVYINGHIVCDSRNGDYSGKTTNLYYAEMTTAGQSFTMDADDLAGILQDGENVIAVEVHNNQSASSDIYFSMDSMTAITVDPNAATFSSVIMNVGADETQRNLTWYTITNKTSTVQFAPATDMIDGAFPTKYETITASTAKATNKVGYYTNKATLTNLRENTDYVYRLVVDEKYSDLYYFTVGSFGDYDFVFVGDPQISTTAHGNEWIDTLEKIDENFDAEFIVSAGDQITTPDSEEQYDLFIADKLASNAVATTIGPVHDSYSSQGKGTAYSEHYNLPNESSEYGVTMAGGNYWYIYNDTLFMNINFEAGTTAQLAQHEEFIRETINANPNTTWQVVIVHAPFFATSYHALDTNTVNIRNKLAPVFADVGIDVVLSGHEHLYARSRLMLDSTTVSDDVVTDNYVISPEGVQYICASSSTGSKFYEKGYNGNDGYIAAENYEKRKSAIHFEVTDTSLAITSYFLDDMSVFDTFTIYNTEDAVHTAGTAVKENEVAATCKAEGSYDEVVYCTECKAELSRTPKTTPVAAHTTKFVDEVPATVENTGVMAHYTCTVCDKLFSDAEGTIEVSADDLVIEKLPAPKDPIVFVVDDVQAYVGKEFDVVISVKENPGIISAKLNVAYDTSIFEVVKVTAGDFAKKTTSSGEEVDCYFYGDTTKSPLVINWCDPMNGNVTTTGTFATITFKVKEDAVVDYYQIDVSYDAASVFDENLVDVPADVFDATISVEDGMLGDVNGDGEVNNKDIALLMQHINGWNVEIDLTVADVKFDGKINNKDIAILTRYINGWDVVLG